MVKIDKTIRKGGTVFRVMEIPFSSDYLDDYYAAHPNYSPQYFPHKAEGVVVEGRNWTI